MMQTSPSLNAREADMTLNFAPSDDVRHSTEQGILRVTIDRAEKRNPLSLGVLERLRQIFTDAAADQSLRVAVITGAGDKAFASGGDLRELAQYRSHADAQAFSLHGKAALDALRHFPVPVIARLNGLALGGGAELAMACDLRFAARTAQIGFIHGKLNIASSWGGGNDLVRLIGPARALQMMMSGSVFDAPTAKDMGLVEGLCPENMDYDKWFNEELAQLAARPAQVMRAFKSIARAASTMSRAEADHLQTEHFAQVWVHEDHWDAVANLERKSR